MQLCFVQGLTEFLPVSSSGHLALAEILVDRPALAGDVGVFHEGLLHVATLSAVFAWFRREIWELRAAFGRSLEAREARRVVALFAFSSVPTAAIGLAI